MTVKWLITVSCTELKGCTLVAVISSDSKAMSPSPWLTSYELMQFKSLKNEPIICQLPLYEIFSRMNPHSYCHSRPPSWIGISIEPVAFAGNELN